MTNQLKGRKGLFRSANLIGSTMGCAHNWKSYNPEPYVTAYYCEYCRVVRL